MKPRRPLSLLQHLALLTVVKLLLLTLLWWAFVRGEQHRVDPDAAAQHLHSPAPAQGVAGQHLGATP